jgi:Fe-S-cluster containining protein
MKKKTEMPPKDFICKRCGICCTELRDGFQNSITGKELNIWMKSAPPYVREWIVDIGHGIHDYFIKPETGDRVTRCPWFRMHKSDRFKQKGAACSIHCGKPPVCKEFPISVTHALNCKCQGFSHLSETALQKLLGDERQKRLMDMEKELERMMDMPGVDFEELLSRGEFLEEALAKLRQAEDLGKMFDIITNEFDRRLAFAEQMHKIFTGALE